MVKGNNDMKTTAKAMKTKTVALSLGLILVAGGLYAADPWEGTWKLNESKSKRFDHRVCRWKKPGRTSNLARCCD
jgi:hypothetical protein